MPNVSQTGNNGSAFAGLSGNTLFYNLTGARCDAVGRFWMIVPAMAIAGIARGEEDRFRPPPAPSRPTGRCSSAWWSASS